jgi:hypothetical protein
MNSSAFSNFKSRMTDNRGPSTSRVRTEDEDPLNLHMFVFHGDLNKLTQCFERGTETLDVNHKDFHGMFGFI